MGTHIDLYDQDTYTYHVEVNNQDRQSQLIFHSYNNGGRVEEHIEGLKIQDVLGKMISAFDQCPKRCFGLAALSLP